METKNEVKNDDFKMKLLTSHPFLKKKINSTTLRLYILLSLLPIIAFALYKYRINAIIHLVVTLIVCVGTEYLYEFFLKKDITIIDGNAILTGLLIFLMLPAYAPYWVGALGGALAIIVIKHLLGGFEFININPACFAICFLNLVLPGNMDNYASGGTGSIAYDLLHNEKALDTYRLMFGNTDGAMGEICVIAILIGAMLLILTGVVDIYVPIFSIISFLIVVMIASGKGADLTYMTAQLASGGFLFAIWFVASDFSSAPITTVGQIIYGVLIGVLIGISRVFFANDRIIYFVILLCNLLVPVIENLTIPKPLFKENLK